MHISNNIHTYSELNKKKIIKKNKFKILKMSDELPKPDQNEEEQENKIVNEESLHDNVTFRSLVSSFRLFFLRKF